MYDENGLDVSTQEIQSKGPQNTVEDATENTLVVLKENDGSIKTLKKTRIIVLTVVLAIIVALLCGYFVLVYSKAARFNDGNYNKYSCIQKGQTKNGIKFLGGAYFEEFKYNNETYTNDGGKLVVLKISTDEDYSNEQLYFEIKVDNKIYKSDQVIESGSGDKFLICRINQIGERNEKILLTLEEETFSISSNLIEADNFVNDLLSSFDAFAEMTHPFAKMVKYGSFLIDAEKVLSDVKNYGWKMVNIVDCPEIYDTSEYKDYKQSISNYIYILQNWAEIVKESYSHDLYSEKAILSHAEASMNMVVLATDFFGLSSDIATKYMDECDRIIDSYKY